MAELIHTFNAGKMNKDLDERLVPNGEYRDALNLEIASSESSQVGAFQNIKGNLELKNKTYNASTGANTLWEDVDYISSLVNPVCIGSVSDENSDRIYWFIASTGASVVAMYNTITKVTSPLIVDKNNILKFSEDKLITGVNVLEGMLLWTDNQTEPKKITIKDWENSTLNFNVHSQIYGRDFIEQDLTTIKKYPLQPPTITMSSTKQKDASGTIRNVTTNVNTSFVYDDGNGNIIPLTVDSDPITVTWEQQNDPAYYRTGDILNFELTENDAILEDAIIRCRVISVIPTNINATQTGAILQVLTVGPQTSGTTTNDQLYKVTLEQEDPFYEFKFARFGYRYKYKNNEISAYSPFSNVAFLPGAFDYSPKEGYNLGMTNNVRQLEISNFVPSDIPIDVDEVDVLYKATNNSNTYIVDSFKPTDDEWINNSFEINTEIIKSVVESNQLLRSYDNVPRWALAQEISANRLLYGNYTQNFNLLNPYTLNSSKINMNVGIQPTEIATESTSPTGNIVSLDGNLVYPSVKSIRTYQLGVAYMDDYGRTTPVLTSNNSSIVVDKSSAQFSNKLTVKLTNVLPTYNGVDQFPYFKYYVKETSREYYNVCLDRFYDAEDGNIWLSFPSAERNKIDEETFLILKKEHDNDEPVTENAKYKVIAIENEAPLFLKEEKLSKGTMDTDFGGIVGLFPTEGTNEIWVEKDGATGFDEVFGVETRATSGQLLRILGGVNVSEYYKISTFTVVGTKVRMVISKVFGPDVGFTTDENGNATTGLSLGIYEVTSDNKPEFTGRFFVKVNQDNILKEKILAAGSSSRKYIRKAISPLYYASWNTQPSESFWKDQWRDADLQGQVDRLFIDKIRTQCNELATRGTGTDIDGVIQISHATGYGRSRSTPPNAHGIVDQNPQMLEQLNTNGALFRFVNLGNGVGFSADEATVYQVTNTTETLGTTYDCQNNTGVFSAGDEWDAISNNIARWTINFKQLETGNQQLAWNPIGGGSNNIVQWTQGSLDAKSYIGIEFLDTNPEDETFSSTNPAIFETEPKEATELDIYFEVPVSYTAADHGNTHVLDWFNCYSFGNGVESDRIRDDYNQPVIGDGVKASATLDEPYREEHRSNGIIFSQIFNSISGVNNLNQFIQAEGITKDVNPEYGSIQKLHSRDTDLITLCENKSMRILANKDALFNADGSANVTSNRAVLGQTVTFAGEFGIATNPESFASFGFRMYYTDANRGTVIRLSRDGITEISDYGMDSFFSDNLRLNNKIIGSWDIEKKNYNISLNKLTPYWQNTLGVGQFDRYNKDPDCNQFVNSLPTLSTTVSFKESVNGFTSRKVYIPESGVSMNNTYFTFKNGLIWEHDVNPLYNTFYGIGPDTVSLGSYYESSFNVIFNESPASVKGFKTLNYSGTGSRNYIYKLSSTGDLEYSIQQVVANNIVPTSFEKTKGWYTNSIITDLQEGQVKEFVDKEGKKFNYITGLDTFFTSNCKTNVDTKEFNVQGIGKASAIVFSPQTLFKVTNTLNEDC